MAHKKISKLNPQEIMARARANADDFVRDLRDEQRRDTKRGLLFSIAPALQEWRKKQFTYVEIAKLLRHNGLPVSPQTIKAAMDEIQQRDASRSPSYQQPAQTTPPAPEQEDTPSSFNEPGHENSL